MAILHFVPLPHMDNRFLLAIANGKISLLDCSTADVVVDINSEPVMRWGGYEGAAFCISHLQLWVGDNEGRITIYQIK